MVFDKSLLAQVNKRNILVQGYFVFQELHLFCRVVNICQVSDESSLVEWIAPNKVHILAHFHLVFYLIANSIHQCILVFISEQKRCVRTCSKGVNLPKSIYLDLIKGVLEPLSPRFHLPYLHPVVGQGLVMLHPAPSNNLYSLLLYQHL